MFKANSLYQFTNNVLQILLYKSTVPKTSVPLNRIIPTKTLDFDELYRFIKFFVIFYTK